MAEGDGEGKAETALRVLLIEDDEEDYFLVKDYLRDAAGGMLVLEWAASYATGRAALARRAHDVALIDYQLGAQSGLELLLEARAAGDLPPAIVLTGAGDPAVDAAAQAAGAADFLTKGRLDATVLERTIRYTLDRDRQRAALSGAQRFLQGTLDALSAHLAVLDEHGTVIAVNTAWRRFAAENGLCAPGCGVGENYLALCDAAVASAARAVAADNAAVRAAALAAPPGALLQAVGAVAAATAGAGGDAEAVVAADVAGAIRDVLAGARAEYTREYPCHAPDEERWFVVRVTRFAGEGETRIVVAHENVTARHRAEERTRQQAQLLDQVPAAVIGMALDGRIRDWNAHATLLYGWTAAEALGQPVAALAVGPADAALGREIVARVLAGETWSGEFPVRRKDGTSFPVYATDSAIRDAAGRVVGVVGVSVDITARRAAEEALQASERNARALLEQAADAIMILTPDGRFATVNARACALTGYDRDELLARTIFDVVPADERAAVPERLQSLGRETRTTARQVRRKDGTAVSTEVSATRLDDGRVQVILRDTTERHAAEEALRASEASLAEAQRIAHVGSWVYDYAADEMRWSDEFYRIVGLPPTVAPTLEGTTALVHPDDRAALYARFAAATVSGASSEAEYRMVRPDGEVRVVLQHAESRLGADGRPTHRLAVVRDVTEQRALEEQLRRQATHDPLTRLPNRPLFLERLTAALARTAERSCAVLLVDLDRFKEVNDTLGHGTGDRLLIAAAARLAARLRPGDLLARLGDDEFTILLGHPVDDATADALARELLEALAAPLALDDQEYRLSASVGVAVLRPDHARPEEVLRDADLALARAKAAGRAGQARFDPAMQRALTDRLALEHDLRLALERDEFALQYQPIVTLDTGRLAKVEALVRWHHPTRGMVSPLAFIPLAEETGLIRPLGAWVLGAACRQAAAWAAAGASVPISVNLTAREFQHPDLVDEVAAALAAAGIPAALLHLEITESLAMRDVTASIATLRGLRALGVRVAVDDFGTGYSSLAYLKRLPIDTLKVDKAFVDGLGQNEEDTAIVVAIITLAHTLGLRVVAEGVETLEQAEHLRRLGCARAQGYHFSRPLPAAALTPHLHAVFPVPRA